MRRVSEGIGNRIVGFGDHIVGKQQVDDAVDILLRDVLLEDRRNVLQNRP
jgi:hypothetical protein